MESIFDGITVPGATTYGFTGERHAAVGSAAAGALGVGNTGLVASVTSVEFEKLVRDSVDAVVLKSSFHCMTKATVAGKARAPSLVHRYVFACSGIVFVTSAPQGIDFGPNVRQIACLGIAQFGQALAPDPRS
jgi:hypothetical protein